MEILGKAPNVLYRFFFLFGVKEVTLGCKERMHKDLTLT